VTRLAEPMGGPHGLPAAVATVHGRHRLPSDVVSELSAALAEEPRIVVCDLAGMGLTPQAMVKVFAPVQPYLSHWPGTLVVAVVPDPSAYSRMLPAAIADRLLVHSDEAAGVAEAQELVRPVDHAAINMPPVAGTARDARAFARTMLRGWQLPVPAESTALVVSELVTDSLRRSRTVLHLSLSYCAGRLRVAVHDHGGAASSSRPVDAHADEVFEDRGPLVVRGLSLAWGEFPDRVRGRTTWAVLAA
jgi:hypothetical protein